MDELEKLRLCCKALRTFVPVNHLIIPSATSSAVFRGEINRLADIPLFDESIRGAGATRALGLSAVETELYASFDADVIVSKQWYARCAKMILEPSVGACQGYQRSTGKLCNKWYEALIFQRGHCDQGNTMLRTEVVREVGMPVEIQGEDAILRKRLAERGYEWIVDLTLSSTHLQSDREFFGHWYRYGKMEPMNFVEFSRYLVWLARHTALQARVEPLDRVFISYLLHATRAVGSLQGMYSGEHSLAKYSRFVASNTSAFSEEPTSCRIMSQCP